MSDKHYTHHEEQTHLETALRQAQPWLVANATFLIYGLAAVLAVLALVVWNQRQPAATDEVSQLWMQAGQPEEFQTIADKDDSSALGRLARLNQAESLLNQASSNLFTDRDAAHQELEEAEAALGRLTNVSGLDRSIQARIAVSRARLAEMTCDGSSESVQAAVAAWQMIVDDFEGQPGEELAKSRVEALGQPDAAEFYAWFHDHKPTAPDELNVPGLPGMSGGPATSVPQIPAGDPAQTPMDSPAETPTEDKTSEETAEEPAADESTESAEEPVKEEAPASEEKAEEEPAEEPSDQPEESTADESAGEESASEEADAPAEEPAAETEPAADSAE